MRIALVYNPTAGRSEFGRERLCRLLEARGHRVEAFGREAHEVREAIAGAPDLIVVAGGDGTVSRAAITSFESRSTVPLFVLPIGTSNNIGRSLGVARDPEELIRGIDGAKPATLDIGRISAPGEERHFVEGVGVGFVGTILRNPMPWPAKVVSAIRGAITGTDVATRTARGVANLLRRHEAFRVGITADGVDLSGDYVAVQAMNIREIGPRLEMAPGADCADGLLDLALVRAADRSVTTPPRRARQIEMTWRTELGHVDDAPWPHPITMPEIEVSIAIAGRVSLLR